MTTENTQLQPSTGTELAVISNAANQLFVANNSPFRKNGLFLDPEIDYTEDDMLELGKTIKNFTDASQFWEGDFLLEMQSRYPDAYKRATELFNRSYEVMKNIVRVCKAVPKEVRRPELTFSHHEEVAKLETPNQKTVLEQAVNFTDPQTGEKRKMNREEIRLAVKQMAAGPGAQVGDNQAPAEQLVAPYITFHMPPFRGMELGENKASYAALLDTHIQEQRKRHLDPKYAQRAAQAERKAMFEEVLEGVPKADRPQFVSMFEEGKTIPEIKQKVREYLEAVEQQEQMEKALSGIPAEEQEQFYKMRGEGVSFKEVKSAISKYIKRKADREALDVELREVEKEDQARFNKMFDGDAEKGIEPKSLKEIKAEIKKYTDAAKEKANREKMINKQLENVPEEDRAQFLLMASEGKSPAQIKDAVKAYRDNKDKEAKDAQKATTNRRKHLRDTIKKQLTAANSLRETNTEANIRQAELIEQDNAKLQAELDALEGGDNREAQKKIEQEVGSKGKPATAGKKGGKK